MLCGNSQLQAGIKIFTYENIAAKPFFLLHILYIDTGACLGCNKELILQANSENQLRLYICIHIITF